MLKRRSLNQADVRVIVKFIVAATGYRRLDARNLFEQVPEDLRPQLFLLSRAWEQETEYKASSQLTQWAETHETSLGMRETGQKARRAHASDPPLSHQRHHAAS